MNEITIVGAGLAGLVLGNALVKQGVRTHIHEASTLPRHRVCGEFLCGRGMASLRSMGLDHIMQDSVHHRNVQWSLRSRNILTTSLPELAYGLSRFAMDQRLADEFQSNGGHLHLNSRWQGTAREGVVLCSGRKTSKSTWIGLKVHCRSLKTATDLEMHLADGVYVGLSAVEKGRVNVCALVQQRPEVKGKKEDLILAYLEAAGLKALAERIREGEMDQQSHVGVAGISFGQLPDPSERNLCLGDAYSVIPPFTGNGMSLAIESAEIAFPHVFAYAQGSQDWVKTSQAVNKELGKKLNCRLQVARILHPWISQPKRQKMIVSLARLHLLPFRLIYRYTH